MAGPIRTLVAGAMALALVACGGNGTKPGPDIPHAGNGDDDQGSGGGDLIGWGPVVEGAHLSRMHGARDRFGADTADAIHRAARTAPQGASQSSLAEDGRTSDEVGVAVVRNDEGALVHEVTDGARFVLHVPGPVPRVGFDLSMFTTLPLGIEPDLTSYPHELLGVWAWESDVGAFWSRSPEIRPVSLDARLVGTATYEGDAAGVYASGAHVGHFIADVELRADFDHHTISGTVDDFRADGIPMSGAGPDVTADITAVSVELETTRIPESGDPFAGATRITGVDSSGHWGARWSDGLGWTMGGTFGVSADDASLGILGAFSACSCAYATDGDPDDPISTP